MDFIQNQADKADLAYKQAVIEANAGGRPLSPAHSSRFANELKEGLARRAAEQRMQEQAARQMQEAMLQKQMQTGQANFGDAMPVMPAFAR